MGPVLRRTLLFAMALALPSLASPVHAFVWPSVPERLGRELAEGGVEARRRAAGRLGELAPKLAEPLVLRALEDADLEVRLEAARVAGRLRLVAASEAVVAWLGESDPRLRLAGCELLRRVPTPNALAALGRVLSDPETSVRLAASAALGELELPEGVLPLLGRLDDPSANVRIEAVRALGRIGDFRAVFALSGKMSDSADEVRIAAARALGELADARGTHALVLALRDRSPEVRVAALESLGRIGADEATLAIVPWLSEIGPVRRAASNALGRLGSATAIDALIRALDEEDPTQAASPIRDALVSLGPRVGERLLAKLASPSSPRAAAHAALTLAALRTDGAGKAIVEAMRRGSVAPELGLRALASSGDSSVVPVALEMLAHARPLVRRQAIEALFVLLDPAHPDGRAVDPLVEALGKPRATLEERIGLVRALGRTGSPRAIPVLAALTRASEMPVRLAAIEALGTLGPLGQDAILGELLRDERADVRLQAAVALASSASEAMALELVEKLALAAEADRGAFGIAVSGAMSRAKDEAVAERADELLASVGPSTRDALLEGLGRMQSARALSALVRVAKSQSPEDRRKVAEALAGHPEGRATLLHLRDDADPGVRAAAVWSLGKLGASVLSELLTSIDDEDGGVAANAVAAAARVARAEKTAPESLKTALCGALSHAQAQVRANALAGLALLGSRCSDGSTERAILRHDESELARSAAAALLARAPMDDASLDRRALLRCMSEEKTAAVAASCKHAKPRSSNEARFPLIVFVVPDGETRPTPLAPFAMRFADGLMRHGQADRRGAVFESAAPEGQVTLVVPGG